MPLANSFPDVGALREIVMFMIAAVLWVLIVAFVPRVWGSRKMKNSDAPAVKREEEEDWGR